MSLKDKEINTKNTGEIYGKYYSEEDVKEAVEEDIRNWNMFVEVLKLYVYKPERYSIEDFQKLLKKHVDRKKEIFGDFEK